MAYSNTWDSTFESTPADTENISQGAERIRILKEAIRERMQKDHYWSPSGTDEDHGEHKHVTLREQASAPSVGSNKASLYIKSDGLYLEKDDGTEICIVDFGIDDLHNADKYEDIPSGEIILFEKDTAVTGYTLQTDVDDMLVYITKGYAAGGETGGDDKAGGTWTQPTHTHNTPNHWHDIPFGGAYGDGNIYVDDNQHIGKTIHTAQQNGRVNGGSWYVASYRTYGNDGAGTTSASRTANTWRPAGRNFTRQKRN
jgi:hypothetical protein